VALDEDDEIDIDCISLLPIYPFGSDVLEFKFVADVEKMLFALKKYFDELNDLLPLKRRIRAVKPSEK
jgi:hypothetical protein